MDAIYPSKDFVKGANIKDPAIYSRASENWQEYWEEFAKELHWFVPWEKFFDDSKAPYYRFFVGGKINASYNCIDRHLPEKRNVASIIWEGENEENKTLTYYDLYREVVKLSDALKQIGVSKGSKVAIYMPVIPETIIAMLACARVGATHIVIFEGYSAKAMAFRLKDSGSEFLITADGYYRRGKIHNLKERVDKALKKYKNIKGVIIVERIKDGLNNDIKEGRDYLYHELLKNAKTKVEAEILDSNHPLFIMYTSGAVAEPKGIIHSTGGYLVHVYATSKIVLDLKENDILWCTANLGWITGHSYVVYGPLAIGSTVFIYEGAPDYPDKHRTFEMIEKYGITVFYTVPTLIRLLQRSERIDNYDLSSLRLLGSVGEPIEPETWIWFYKKVGKEKCPIVDTWWQTETGGHVIAPIPSLTPLKPGSVTKALPGMEVDIVDESGNRVKPYRLGNLVIKRPFPGFMLGFYGDPRNYVDLYWKKYGKRVFFTSDLAYFDEDGYIWIMGRSDDVLNISGHRISLVEIEQAVMEIDGVKECAAIELPDKIKGGAIAIFVSGDATPEEIESKLESSLGRFARPRLIVFLPELPKSGGKVFKRAISDAILKKEVSPITSNPEIVKKISENVKPESSGVIVIL